MVLLECGSFKQNVPEKLLQNNNSGSAASVFPTDIMREGSLYEYVPKVRRQSNFVGSKHRLSWHVTPTVYLVGTYVCGL